MLRTRIITALLLVALTLALLLCRGVAVFFTILALTLVCQFELVKAFTHKGVKPYLAPVYSAGVLSVAASYFLGIETAVPVLLLCSFAAVCTGIFLKEQIMERIIHTCFIIFYPCVCFACIVTLERIDFPLLLCGIFAAVGCDTLGFFVGSAMGKHKLCPALSPKKTVEGALAGIFGGALFLLIVKFVFKYLEGVDITYFEVVFCGLLGAATSITGDLFASSIKRYSGIKDFSTMLPGHGGILDRLDGVLFSVSAMYFFVFIRNLI